MGKSKSNGRITTLVISYRRSNLGKNCRGKKAEGKNGRWKKAEGKNG